MLIEIGIEVEEIGEEPSRRYLAGKFIQVAVGVIGQIAHTPFLFPNLNGEDGCGAVAHTLIR